MEEAQQGDNLGGLLSDLVLHPILLNIQELFSSQDEEDEHMSHVSLQLRYRDDANIIARHDQLLRAVETLSTLHDINRGLHSS